MYDEKKYKTEVIIDLMELRHNNLKMQSLSIQEGVMVQNSAFYSTLDCLIAVFMDKYKITHEDLEEVIFKRSVEKEK